MRLPDQKKRLQIMSAAARLFTEQPFNKVRLDDVAEAAGVGKGTLYIYFKSKEDLYYSLVVDEFAAVGRRIEELLSKGLDFPTKVRQAVEEVAMFGARFPKIFDVMRTAGVPDASSVWDKERKHVADSTERLLRQGIEAGELHDPRPDLTALYIPAMLRSAMLYRPDAASASELVDHISNLLLSGMAGPARRP